jgi:hypothetical protein
MHHVDAPLRVAAEANEQRRNRPVRGIANCHRLPLFSHCKAVRETRVFSLKFSEEVLS